MGKLGSGSGEVQEWEWGIPGVGVRGGVRDGMGRLFLILFNLLDSYF